MAKRGMELVKIERYKLDEIEDTLRLAHNIHQSSKKETCFDRCVVRSWDYTKDALKEHDLKPDPNDKGRTPSSIENVLYWTVIGLAVMVVILAMVILV